MAEFTLKIVDAQGQVKACDTAEDLALLVYNKAYEPGDAICVETSEKNIHVWLQLDDALGKVFVYLTGNTRYEIPFEAQRYNLAPKAFSGEKHLLSVRLALPEEAAQYRNLALNVYDRHNTDNLYPHATANVETRGESVFFASNAIDGVVESRSHGLWPYASWGINRRDDAEWTLDFGREIETDRIIIFTRSDFPHDNWWVQATITFSDGTEMVCPLEKTRFAQEVRFSAKRTTSVKLSNLIKADDPSPFPALTQVEVYGKDVK